MLENNNDLQPVKNVLKKAVENISDKAPEKVFEELAEVSKDNKPKVDDEINKIKEALGVDPIPVESLITKDDYYHEKEEKIFGKGFIDSHQTSYQLHDSNHKENLTTKISSQINILKLKRLGFEDAKELYKVFNERNIDTSSIYKSTISQFLELKMSAQDIAKGMDRVEKLGFRIKYDNLNHSEGINAIQQITSIPDEKFNKFTAELNPYSFLSQGLKKQNELILFESDDNKYFYQTNPIFDKFLESAKNGQLNDEVKTRLDLLKETILLETFKNSDLGTALTGNKDDYGFYQEIDIQKEVYKAKYGNRDSNSDILNILDTNSKILFKTKISDDTIFNSDFKFIYKNLDYLNYSNKKSIILSIPQAKIEDLPNNENGSAFFLKELFRAQIEDKKQNYGKLEDSFDKIINFTIKNKDKIKSSFKDEDKRSDFLLELVKIGINEPNFMDSFRSIYPENRAHFSNQNDIRYWHLFSQTKNIDFARSLINEKEKYFDNKNSPSAELLKTIINNNEYGTVQNNIYMCNIFLTDENFAKLSSKDKLIWSFTNNLSKYSTDKVQIFIDKFSEFSEFIDKNESNLSIVFEKIIKDYGSYCLTERNSSNEILNSLSFQDKTFWNIYKDLALHHKSSAKAADFLNSKENFSQYFDGDKLNFKFFSMVGNNFNQDPESNIITKYLIDENINKLTDEKEKLILSAFKGFIEKSERGPELGLFLNPLLTFIKTDALKQKDFDDIFSMISKQNNNIFTFEKVLSIKDITENMSPKDKLYWQVYKDLLTQSKNSIFAKTINSLLENKNDFFNLLDKDNNLNSSFIENLLNNKIKIPKFLLTDEKLVNFSDQDKAFWSSYRNLSNGGTKQDIINTFFLKNKSNFSDFLDQDNKLNNLFFESAFKQEIYFPEIFFSDEKLINFSNQDKRMWLLIWKLKDQDIGTFIIDNKNKINDIFKSKEVIDFLNLDKDSDIEVGKLFNHFSNNDYAPLSNYEIKNTIALLSNNEIEINENNWQSLLISYVYSEEIGFDLNPDFLNRMKTIFDNPKARNLCLREMQSSWKSYLDSGKPEEIPISLKILSKYIDRAEGAGPLSQIESLSFLINSVDNSLKRKTTTSRTKTEILTGLLNMEERFTNNRWSNEDKTNFYNISKDVIDAAPSLFSDYLTLFKKLSSSELKLFSEEVYPLYKTKLVLIEKVNEEGVKYYKNNELLDLRKDIRAFTDFNLQKEKLINDIKQLFTTRFEIIKTPEKFTPENIRSIKNISMFLSNLNEPTPEKEAILGFYLSLTINNLWDDFRNGKEINPSDYISENKNEIIRPFLQKRQELISAVIKDTGVEAADLPEFIQLLQSETKSVKIGDVETVDIKLNNIINNLDELQDLDLYPDSLDKQRIELLQTWGNKEVGSTVAKLYQQLSNPAKNISLSENETKIKQKITEICQENSLDINNPQIIKENFQDGIKQFSTLANMSLSIEKLNVQEEIETLRKDLEPSPEIISIFTRLGEDFKVSSGAVALSQDLDYLDNLVVKKEELINPEERTVISDYISTIKNQVLKLEEIYSEVKNKFENLKQGNSSSQNVLLNQKLKEIETIINNQSTQQIITSTATNNLNTITENIRACLSCTNKGCNNDTDLTFGDINKFYLYSQSENKTKGNISDQLAYLEPITRADGSIETSFVIDNLYGTRTPSILENQVETIIKKSRMIKQRFPNSKISVFVSDAALSSSGALAETLIKNLSYEKIFAQKEEINVDIIESAAADHYIEIGGESRTSGERTVNGIIINI